MSTRVVVGSILKKSPIVLNLEEYKAFIHLIDDNMYDKLRDTYEVLLKITVYSNGDLEYEVIS